jgi:hypothetical protein
VGADDKGAAEESDTGLLLCAVFRSDVSLDNNTATRATTAKLPTRSIAAALSILTIRNWLEDSEEGADG